MNNGADTRLRMIEVAERLFAERGIGAVSLREIGAQAGQRNTAAARYHFGTKQGLVDAIFQHRMSPINLRRMEMLAAFDRDGRGYDLRALTEAYLYPLSEMLGEVDRPSWYLRFCTHAAYLEGTAPTDLGRQDWTRGVHIVKSRLAELLSHLPDAVAADRWSLFAGYMTHALADRELNIQHGRPALLSDRNIFLADLVDTAVALASAPVSDATRAQMGVTFASHP
ncbi:MAG TPA: helix-turn-helix domain-containing protein [Acidimicrobiales bacterium]